MAEEIDSFFELKIKPSQENDLHAIELATAALLIEMIHRDDDVSENEYQAVFNTLKSQFNLDQQHAEELYQLAESELKHTTDFSRFTKLICQHFSNTDKLKMVELLWRMAYSDRQLHREEAYFVQEIANLLEVKQEDFDRCRNLVRDEVI